LGIADQLLVGDQHPHLGGTKTVQLQRSRSGKQCELRRRLAAGQHQAAQMRRFSHGLEYPTVAVHAVSVTALALARFEQRLRIVEHQQTSPGSEQMQ
jgi:hypothetical protein